MTPDVAEGIIEGSGEGYGALRSGTEWCAAAPDGGVRAWTSEPIHLFSRNHLRAEGLYMPRLYSSAGVFCLRDLPNPVSQPADEREASGLSRKAAPSKGVET